MIGVVGIVSGDETLILASAWQPHQKLFQVREARMRIVVRSGADTISELLGKSSLNGNEVPMAWKGSASAIFHGGSGQMAVIGELLHRECNAAIPYVDIGMDVFAFRDEHEDVARIQVKTALGKPYKKSKGYNAPFRIPMKLLERTDAPSLFYALAVRLENEWGNFIVISRAKLQELWGRGLGSENPKSGDLELHIQFRLNEKKQEGDAGQTANDQKWSACCGDVDLTDYINAWESLPPLKPPVSIPDTV